MNQPTVTICHAGGECDLRLVGIEPLATPATANLKLLREGLDARLARLADLPEVLAVSRLETERTRAASGLDNISAAIETLKMDLTGAIGDDARVALLTSRISKHEADARALALVIEAVDSRLPAVKGERSAAVRESMQALVGDERRVVAAEAAELAGTVWKAAGPMIARLEGLAMFDRVLMSCGNADSLSLIAEARRRVDAATK